MNGTKAIRMHPMKTETTGFISTEGNGLSKSGWISGEGSGVQKAGWVSKAGIP